MIAIAAIDICSPNESSVLDLIQIVGIIIWLIYALDKTEFKRIDCSTFLSV